MCAPNTTYKNIQNLLILPVKSSVKHSIIFFKLHRSSQRVFLSLQKRYSPPSYHPTSLPNMCHEKLPDSDATFWPKALDIRPREYSDSEEIDQEQETAIDVYGDLLTQSRQNVDLDAYDTYGLISRALHTNLRGSQIRQALDETTDLLDPPTPSSSRVSSVQQSPNLAASEMDTDIGDTQAWQEEIESSEESEESERSDPGAETPPMGEFSLASYTVLEEQMAQGHPDPTGIEEDAQMLTARLEESSGHQDVEMCPVSGEEDVEIAVS